MPYIFVVNDIYVGDTKTEAQTIASALLSMGVWLYNPSTPHVRRLRIGDHVLVYVAGKGRRYFSGSFQIHGNVGPQKLRGDTSVERALLSLFTLYTPISNVLRWDSPQPIVPIKDQLSFITDRKNWGLHLRQAIKAIPEADFKLIRNTQDIEVE